MFVVLVLVLVLVVLALVVLVLVALVLVVVRGLRRVTRRALRHVLRPRPGQVRGEVRTPDDPAGVVGDRRHDLPVGVQRHRNGPATLAVVEREGAERGRRAVRISQRA